MLKTKLLLIFIFSRHVFIELFISAVEFSFFFLANSLFLLPIHTNQESETFKESFKEF